MKPPDNTQPPQWALRFFRWYCHPEYQEDIEGDLRERFERRVKADGEKKAHWELGKDVIRLFRPGIIQPFHRAQPQTHISLLKNYFTLAFRNLEKKKLYTTINILGLSIGIGVCITAFRWVEQELSYDRFHPKAHSIYRVLLTDTEDGFLYQSANDPALLGPKLLEEIPQAENFTRISFLDAIKLFRYEDKIIEKASYIFADPAFLDMFSFQLLQGNPENALSTPSSIILTKQIAEQLFGKVDPLGKEITIHTDQRLVVTGVLEDIPANSHLQFDFLLPMSFFTNNAQYDGQFNTWRNSGSNTYVQLLPSVSIEEISWQATELYMRQSGRLTDSSFDYETSSYKIALQPLLDIHLHSSQINADSISNHTDVRYIYLFSGIAVILLMIACINFINIETSRAITRAKEVGVRKVLGVSRTQLIKQFLIESTVVTFLSMVQALLLVYLILPYFSDFTWYDLLADFQNTYFVLGLSSILIATALLSGIYPALVLSSFYPLKALQQKSVFSSRKVVFRKVLVTAQFSASMLLLIGALVVQKQLSFIQDKPLGYTKENLVAIPLKGEAKNKADVLKNELLAFSEITSVTVCSEALVNVKNNTELEAAGIDEDSYPKVSYIFADEDFFQTYQLDLIEGKIFSTTTSSDNRSFVLNESAAKLLGTASLVGSTMTINGTMEGEVTGIVANFHFQSLHQKIEPCVIVNNPPIWGVNQLVVKLSGDEVSETLAYMQDVFKQVSPTYGFDYQFIDQSIKSLYGSEANMSMFLDYFGVLTLIVAGLGLFGLASFLTQQKAKEVAVRKVLGATFWQVTLLNLREFMYLLTAAALISIPVGYYLMSGWLENFFYRINLSIVFAITALLVTLLMVLIAVAYHTIVLSNTQPAQVLKNE
ncbi:MAG: ABC transporter permease [Cyclobacteriaceae bacterium]